MTLKAISAFLGFYHSPWQRNWSEDKFVWTWRSFLWMHVWALVCTWARHTCTAHVWSESKVRCQSSETSMYFVVAGTGSPFSLEFLSLCPTASSNPPASLFPISQCHDSWFCQCLPMSLTLTLHLGCRDLSSSRFPRRVFQWLSCIPAPVTVPDLNPPPAWNIHHNRWQDPLF